MYNNISRYNEQALWTYPELAGLAIESLESNHIEITTSDMYIMPSSSAPPLSKKHQLCAYIHVQVIIMEEIYIFFIVLD